MIKQIRQFRAECDFCKNTCYQGYAANEYEFAKQLLAEGWTEKRIYWEYSSRHTDQLKCPDCRKKDNDRPDKADD